MVKETGGVEVWLTGGGVWVITGVVWLEAAGVWTAMTGPGEETAEDGICR